MDSDSHRAAKIIRGGGGTGAAAGLRPPDQGLKCPRCDSPNTKFCYYNNYSLTQPRHFCKSCRRYWTKGGALRNIPVGGCCRRNRKPRSSSSSSTSSTSASAEPDKAVQVSQTAVDFLLPLSTPCFSYNDRNNTYRSITASMESLSSINLDLHWRLQQERMQLLFRGEEASCEKETIVSFMNSQAVEPSSSFRAVVSNKDEIFIGSSAANGTPKNSEEADASTAWYLDGSFAMPTSTIGTHDFVQMNNNGSSVTAWNGFAGWSDAQHFTALP